MGECHMDGVGELVISQKIWLRKCWLSQVRKTSRTSIENNHPRSHELLFISIILASPLHLIDSSFSHSQPLRRFRFRGAPAGDASSTSSFCAIWTSWSAFVVLLVRDFHGVPEVVIVSVVMAEEGLVLGGGWFGGKIGPIIGRLSRSIKGSSVRGSSSSPCLVIESERLVS